MTQTVKPRHTLAQGTLAAQAELIGQAGTPKTPADALIRATSHAENLGTITLHGATQGATNILFVPSASGARGGRRIGAAAHANASVLTHCS
jgi:hypothetical protein